MSFTTYIIRDPRDNKPIYVGQTTDFEKRKQHHLKNAAGTLPNIRIINIHVYLVKLNFLGFDPEFEIVERNDTEEDSLCSETSWIQKLVDEGNPLLNRTREHRAIVKSKFSSDYLKSYFSKRLMHRYL